MWCAVWSVLCMQLQGLWGPDSPTGDKGSPLSGGGTKQQVFLQPQGDWHRTAPPGGRVVCDMCSREGEV